MSEETGEPIIADRFEAIEEGNDVPFLRFDLVENKRSNRPDLHAMHQQLCLELLRCGVFYDSDNDSLTMFV